jgi:Histidine kinase-, DNA gyrase B-, and HSP90-like ATPase
VSGADTGYDGVGGPFVNYEIANPHPAGTIESLRSLGYSTEAAVADLVDNSIAAEARQVDVSFMWDGRKSWVAVVDDGHGMTEPELVTAMTIAARGPGTPRTPRDLGRFGMGLKTASFSQARQLIVTSAADGHQRSTRVWDLELVRRTEQWRLLQDAGPDDGLLENLWTGRGTIVLWRHLHRFDLPGVTADDVATQKHFYDEIRRVEAHLGMVFGRFLNGQRGLKLSVNGNPVQSWDPFLQHRRFSQRLAAEEIPIGGQVIRVAGFVLPHLRYLSDEEARQAAGPRGWLEQQGFYVYRRDRLILAGDWLGIRGFRKEDKYILARVAVDIPAELDSEWSIDVRKSAAIPPLAARPHLQRIGAAARSAAAAVLTHRGRVTARERGADFVYAWTVHRSNGQVTCRVNRQHPLVRQVLRGGTDDSADAAALIRLLEETVPVAALRVMHQAETIDDPEPFTGTTDEETVKVAERIQAALIAQGWTPHEARRRIRLMPPFDQMAGFWNS